MKKLKRIMKNAMIWIIFHVFTPICKWIDEHQEFAGTFIATLLAKILEFILKSL